MHAVAAAVAVVSSRCAVVAQSAVLAFDWAGAVDGWQLVTANVSPHSDRIMMMEEIKEICT